MPTEQELAALIGLLYEAAMESGRWPQWLVALGARVGASHGVLARAGGGGDGPEVLARLGGAEARQRGATTPPGAAPEAAEGAAPDDHLEPAGSHTLGGTLRVEDEGSAVRLVLWRPPEAAPFGAEEASVVEALAPHLRRAMRLHLRLARLQTERDAVAVLLQGLPVAVVLLDEEGRVAFSNERAGVLLAQGAALLLAEGSLAAADAEANAALHGLIAEAVRGQPPAGQRAGGAMTVARGRGAAPLQVVVTPLGGPSALEGLAALRLRAAVLVGEPEAPVGLAPPVLQALYGLTAAEARLALGLAQGRDLDELAAAFGLSRHTVRTQLKQVFAKSGTRRQPELVRLLLTGPAAYTGDLPP